MSDWTPTNYVGTIFKKSLSFYWHNVLKIVKILFIFHLADIIFTLFFREPVYSSYINEILNKLPTITRDANNFPDTNILLKDFIADYNNTNIIMYLIMALLSFFFITMGFLTVVFFTYNTLFSKKINLQDIFENIKKNFITAIASDLMLIFIVIAILLLAIPAGLFISIFPSILQLILFLILLAFVIWICLFIILSSPLKTLMIVVNKSKAFKSIVDSYKFIKDNSPKILVLAILVFLVSVIIQKSTYHILIFIMDFISNILNATINIEIPQHFTLSISNTISTIFSSGYIYSSIVIMYIDINDYNHRMETAFDSWDDSSNGYL